MIPIDRYSISPSTRFLEDSNQNSQVESPPNSLFDHLKTFRFGL
jgi:hypothetical protein